MIKTEYLCDYCGDPFDPTDKDDGKMGVEVTVNLMKARYDLCKGCLCHLQNVFRSFDDKCSAMKKVLSSE